MPRRLTLPLLALLVLLSAAAVTAQEIEDCLACHDDTELTMNRPDGVVSLFVDEDVYARSIHGREGLTCVDCHTALEGMEDEHDTPVPDVDCADCHDDVAAVYGRSIHGREVAKGNDLAPHCWDCHGKHDILPASDPDSRVNHFNVPVMCGRCHKEGAPVARMFDIPADSILTNYSQSIHGVGLFKKGLVVTAVCTDCHTDHSILPHTDPASTINKHNVARTCEKCHARIEDVHQKVINGELWEKEPHKVPACVDCHEPHKARKVFYEQGVSRRQCLECHGKPDFATVSAQGETLSLYVDMSDLRHSAHAKVACAQCHTGTTPDDPERPCRTVAERVDCSVCHEDEVAQFKESVHGTLLAKGDPDAPYCTTCHGTHDIKRKDDHDSPVYVSNVAATCARCHGAGGAADRRYAGPDKGMVEDYANSIHGRAVQEKGLVVAATCADCHTAHHELPSDDPRSTIHRARIAETCGRCHEGIFDVFKTSIHYTGRPRDGERLPVCNDCHSSHRISNTKLNAFQTEIIETCGHCHEQVTETYFESFHGKMVQLGFAAAAKCQDCHGAHDILPRHDPRSHISRENIVNTCGQCHEASHERFAGFQPHATHRDKHRYPFVYWTWLFMTVLLVGTFIFFGVHTLLWLPRSFQAMKHGRYIRQKAKGQPQIQRFTRLQRNLHLLVIISFLSLAVTGMTLKFSYLGWARFISHLLGGFETTSVIHRIAALITFFYFIRHLVDVYQRWRASGKSLKAYLLDPNSMVPNKRDLVELGQTFKWFIGMGPRPEYGRWTYWEKFDYFAVFWGVAMIGGTGLTLWFPEFFTHFLPGWFLNVAAVIHSDEALLAVGFIFTIHFFNTHFRPDKFPMDPVIFAQAVPLEELKEDRPREYRELVERGELERLTMEPVPERELKWLRIFGFCALGIGLSLILLIIFTELLGYG